MDEATKEPEGLTDPPEPVQLPIEPLSDERRTELMIECYQLYAKAAEMDEAEKTRHGKVNDRIKAKRTRAAGVVQELAKDDRVRGEE